MHPVLFHLFGYPVESAGTLYLLAAIIAGVYLIRRCRRLGGNPDDVIPGVFLTVTAAYGGARLHGAILARGSAPFHPLRELVHPSGGLSFFGGLMLGSFAVICYLRWKRYALGPVLDQLAPLAPVLYALFRLGCLLNGDDLGPPTTLPWGMRFPLGSPPAESPVHPTPLYEILLMVPVFLWLRRRSKVGLPAGALMCECCILLGSERFLVEFWRPGPDWVGGLGVAQGFALLLVAIGVVGRRLLDRKRPRVMTAPVMRSEDLHA